VEGKAAGGVKPTTHLHPSHSKKERSYSSSSLMHLLSVHKDREKLELLSDTPAVAKPLSFRLTNSPSVHVSLDEQFVDSITSVRTFVPIYYVYGSRLFVAFKFDLRLSCKLMQDKGIRTACKHTDRRQTNARMLWYRILKVL
jgi:hypothetical protein